MTEGAADARFDVQVLATADAPPGADVHAAWADLYRTSLHRTPYGRLAYGQAIAEATGLGYAVHGAYEGAKLVAGLVHFEQQRLGMRRGIVPPFTLYTPLLQRAPTTESEVHAGQTPVPALLSAARARCPGGLALHLPPAEQDVRPYLWAGWTGHPLYTYRLELSTEDAWLASCSSSTRRLLRKAVEAHAVDVVWAVGPTGDDPSVARAKMARTIAALCQDSYARHERPLPLAPSVLEQFILRAAELGLADLIVAYDPSGDPTAGLALLTDGERAAYWVAGSVPGPGMTALLGLLTPRLIARGCMEIDLVGANTASIAEFKRRLGGTLQPFFRVESTPPWQQVLRSLRALVTSR